MSSEDTSQQETTSNGLDMASQIENMEKVNAFRLAMLRGQVEWDFNLGKPNKKGQRTKPTVRNNNRALFDAFDIMEGRKAHRCVDDSERRSCATIVEYLNSLMLKIVADKAKEQESLSNTDTKTVATDAAEKQGE